MIKPQWEAAANGSLALKRTGVVLLEFAPANPGQGGQAGYGSRSYDWNNKQVNLLMKYSRAGAWFAGMLFKPMFVTDALVAQGYRFLCLRTWRCPRRSSEQSWQPIHRRRYHECISIDFRRACS